MEHLARGRAHAKKSHLSRQSNPDGRIVGPGVRKRKVMYIMCVCTYGTMYGCVGSMLY
jgi:hypothetical protein